MKPAADFGWLVADALQEAAKDGLEPLGAVTRALGGTLLLLGDAGRQVTQQAPRVPDEAQLSKIGRLARGVQGAERWLHAHTAEAMANRPKRGIH
ncbi:hypothetical protein GCM10011521_12180 [Arenimonas soli]|uniref:Uncharacterized protein n=1 Tax=Arenimonas soli TaxID=2269504 RepID=A0ABQ1HGR8_9GAMM|nr:hypothetical protein [Arenimonas soli]GGA75577.1 hypothetical protein GCM10011521_12180 [Arenimonas soli]